MEDKQKKRSSAAYNSSLGHSSVYVDESAGSDESGDGSKQKPFASSVGAMLAKGPDSSVFIKKSGEEAAKDADEDGYVALTASGAKKAKKAYEVALKRKQKQTEQASKAQADEGNEEKKLEESKKIVLEEPKGDYKKVRCLAHDTSLVSDLHSY